MRVVKSSGNVFRDLNVPDPEGMLRKSEIVFRITKAIRAQKLSTAEAGRLCQVDPSLLKLWFRGRFQDTSEAELERCLKCIEKEN